jgi:hypothetical protein
VALLTATDVTVYSSISASAATIAASGLIAAVQDRIVAICNNTFTTDLDLQSTVTFNATALTVVTTGGEAWADWGFVDGDEVYIYRSYRNDGYYTVTSVSGSVMTLVTGSTVVDELSGRSVMVSVVKWPSDLKPTAARMVAYDYDTRPTQTPGLRSKSLGPWSESYGGAGGATGAYGYPEDLLEPLYDHRMARLM